LCLNSALAIATAFEALPLPEGAASSVGLAPRTMPSFACCAMQSAYTLLMVYHRTWVLAQQQEEDTQGKATQLLAKCDQGLRSILSALDNYAVAFEALGGMRDQVQAALDCLSLV
jgi:hypothetical protein